MTDNARPSIDLKDDLRQAAIVGKYEIIKFFSGKKIFVFGGIVVALAILVGALMHFFPDDMVTTKSATSQFVSFVTLLLLIGATMFSSVALVSEFEDRTAFTLFTKRVRKYSIFLGKFGAAYLLNLGTVLVFYIIGAITVAILTGGFAAEIFVSFGYAALYAFALTGIGIFFSALMKKSSTASIMTFIFILLIPSIVAMIILAVMGADGELEDFWFILDMAANSIINCFDGPVAGVRDALVMFAWGLVPAVGGYFLFHRREV